MGKIVILSNAYVTAASKWRIVKEYPSAIQVVQSSEGNTNIKLIHIIVLNSKNYLKYQ